MAEVLLNEAKTEGRARSRSSGKPSAWPVALPYIHRFCHRLKKVAAKCGVSVVFSAPEKLARMCPVVNGRKEKSACSKKHATPFVSCEMGVVYKIPLTCGRCYIGQTGRCLNDRLREHRAAVDAQAAGGHLADHCRRCGCAPELTTTRVLKKGKDQATREIIEAFAISENERKCVSVASIALSRKELDYLKGNLAHVRW